ncbi:Flp family type IVb pilin [Micromonospora endolithica]|uniref:Flp family type IVb pilin n=1 Tax=Micromonospora endolithica TaxID=230091 RepID=A0A3A9ZFW6_9ACTN|nr:Flp family type IVb pilin [Micromonospora endolithica]RKN46237.1 Flp family type IVb pilin [Micromonospora endolithica]TWJ25042.1 pilus assembly protein Flp/PilA [Micromonospora endolithica]
MLEFIHRVMAWHESRDRGASAVEYALILGVIVAIAAAAFAVIGGRINVLLFNACRAIGGGDAC